MSFINHENEKSLWKAFWMWANIITFPIFTQVVSGRESLRWAGQRCADIPGIAEPDLRCDWFLRGSMPHERCVHPVWLQRHCVWRENPCWARPVQPVWLPRRFGDDLQVLYKWGDSLFFTKCHHIPISYTCLTLIGSSCLLIHWVPWASHPSVSFTFFGNPQYLSIFYKKPT